MTLSPLPPDTHSPSPSRVTLTSPPPPPPLPPAGLQAGRFVAIMSTALAMTACVAHLMELPAKMHLERSLYVRLHRTLYLNFGRIAGPAEGLAVVSCAALALWSRTKRPRPRAFPLTAAAAGSLAAAHGIFWSVVNPVNIEMVKWPLDSIPPDWMAYRDRWEYGHATRAFLITSALATLIASLLAETGDASSPSRTAAEHRASDAA
jgi:hypothetical protein